MQLRIAAVQNGDYVDARRRMGAGEKEFYFGVRHSLDSLDKLFQGHHHLVISLGAPPGETTEGLGQFVGLPEPSFPSFIPLRFVFDLWARRIVRHLRRFRPTHVFVREGGLVGLRIVQFCLASRIPMLVVLANSLEDRNPYNQRINRKLVGLLNDPLVDRVGNYKTAATRSLTDYGLIPEKAVAYEFPPTRRPEQFPVKSRRAADPIRLCFAGRMDVAKGCLDVVDATRRILDAGHQIRTTVIGDGPALEQAKKRASDIDDRSIEFTGWIDSDTMFDHLLNCDIATVPTHHEFIEGMPITLTEALASRSPVVISDVQVFRESFKDEEGVCFFPAADARKMADTILAIAKDEQRHRKLSETTIQAFQRVSCDTSFADIVLSWRKKISDK